MRAVECPHEIDVLDAVASGRWPSRCDEELTTHVAECEVCTDLVAVVVPLTDARDELWPQIQVPSPGTVWWRAQVRARQEAARQASRPITVVQVAASAAALVLVVGLSYVLAPWLAGISIPRVQLPSWVAMPSLPELSSIDVQAFRIPTVAELGMWEWAVIAAVVTWAIIAPLVIYLAVADEERSEMTEITEKF